MSDARQRLERAIARLEAALQRPAPAAHGDATALQARYDRLAEASRQAVARIDRLLAGDAA